MSDHREAITEALAAHRRVGRLGCKCGTYFRASAMDDDAILAEHDAHLADALLGSDVLAQIRAEARAEALRPVEALLAGYEAWTGADPFDEFASSPKQRAQLRAALDAGGSA